MERDDLSTLAVFLAVAEERSFTRAGKRLGVSPSATRISVTIPVPALAYSNRPGTKIGLTYGLLDGKKKLAIAQPIVKLQTGGYVTIPVNYTAVKGKTYNLGVTLNDPHGHVVKTTILLMPASSGT